MIELKITDIDIFSLNELDEQLKNQKEITYKYLPIKGKNGRILACDSQMGDISIQVMNYLANQSEGLSWGLLITWLQQQIEKENVGMFFSIGTCKVDTNNITEEQLRKIIQEELKKEREKNGTVQP